MKLLLKAVVLEVGCSGCKRTPKSFDLLESWAKSLKIRVKWRLKFLGPKKWRPRLVENHMKTCFGGHTKKRS